MKPKHPKPPFRQRARNGFALVITLSLMVLLTVIAVGLLTLSSISLRSSGAGEARAEAQANARMALMLAIGELQTSLGPDQAVSARASVINDGASEPNMLGAWKSWHWEPGSGSPTYSEKAGQFSNWLVSTPEPGSATNVSLPDSGLSDPVWLINPDTVGSPGGTNEVGPALRGDKVPMRISDKRFGAFAWAVMDESQKAPIQLPEVEPRNDGERIARRIAPARDYPEAILPSLSTDSLGDPGKLVSLESAVVAVGKNDGEEILGYQGDVTPYSVGLLSNVIDGGLKTDLTTVFESNTSSNPNGLPTVYFTTNDGAPRWDYLRNHYQYHRQMSFSDNGTPTMRLRPERPAGNGLTVSPNTERLMPVIAKLQVMFSVVSHYNHLQDRKTFYDTYGSPKGNEQYAAPHLVYDPVVTIYNPYDVALDLQNMRIRIWDPPVVFRFRKNANWLRPEFASGEFHGLARFQIANERNANARRYFTLSLSGGEGNTPGGNIKLAPGEVKVFSPYVEEEWNWALETNGGYSVRCFFDWNAGNDFGNKDGRTKNQYGIDSVPGWDPRAGLQTDHLAYGSRPRDTRYNFELPQTPPYPDPYANGIDGGWLVIKMDDTFSLEAKAGRTVTVANQPDFTVDLLAGRTTDPTRDMLRTYRFKYNNPTADISANTSNPVIRRTYKISDILQKPDDKTVAGKAPFALLTMSAKTTKTQNDISIPWLHNHPVVEGADMNSGVIGSALDSYDVRLEEVSDFNSNGGIELDPGTNRGFYGATPYANDGVSNVPMFRVPLLPAASLGDLIPANLVASSNLPRVTHALGNSRAHPLIPSDSVTRTSPSGGNVRMLDHSYLINDALWDTTFFSTVANFSNALLPGTGRSQMLQEFLAGESKLLNPRFVPMLQGEGSVEDQAQTLDSLGDPELSQRIGSAMAIQGPFNVNSDSVGAWKAMLSSLRDQDLIGWGKREMSPKNKTAFSRTGMPIAGDAEDPGANASIEVAGQVRWAGFRALDDDQISLLANKIVEQIRLRGAADSAPSLTLGEFVNRRLGGASGLHVLAGLLQTAIDESNLNDVFHAVDSRDLRSTAVPNQALLTGIANPAARAGFSAEGAPQMLTQGDLLMALAPVITVRGDTFRIRAYGESQDSTGKVGAKAWCEAIVQRVPEYLDPSDSPELKTEDLQEEANVRFGRRFVITSFRWLSPEEV